MQANALIKHLSRTGWPQPAIVEFMGLVQAVSGIAEALNECMSRINALAIGHLVTETVMEHHGLWTPEVAEAIKPLLATKMQPVVQAGAEALAEGPLPRGSLLVPVPNQGQDEPTGPVTEAQADAGAPANPVREPDAS